MTSPTPARTYNQYHVPRKYTPAKRRMSIYWTWSYPWESQRDPAAMENRFSTMTEVRTVLWPNYETPEYSIAPNAARVLQQRMSVAPRKRQLATKVRRVVKGQ
jgi:hypothetical protein